MQIAINFYDELKLVENIKTFGDFKEKIALLYSLDPTDVDELIMKYNDEENDVITINNEDDFQIALKLFSIGSIFIINLEISEKSRLFKSQLGLEKINSSKKLTEKELIEREILEKTKELEMLIKLEEEKSLNEKKKQEKEAKEKVELELKKLAEKDEKDRKIAELQQQNEESEKMVKEVLAQQEKQMEAEKKLRDEIILELVTNTVDQKMAVVREEMIKKTVGEVLKQIDIKFDNPKPDSDDCHYGVTCDGCGVYPIVGIRYKCGTCSNFDFCEKCEAINGESHGHPLIKMRTNKQSEMCFAKGGLEFIRKKFSGCLKNVNLDCIDINLGKFVETAKEIIKPDNVKSNNHDEITLDVNIAESKIDDIKIEQTANSYENENDAVFKIQAEQIKGQYELNVNESRVVEVLKMHNGDYEKTVTDLFNEQSILFKK